MSFNLGVVFLNVSIFFFSEIGEVMASSTTLGFDLTFPPTVSIVPYFSTVSIVATNGFSI